MNKNNKNRILILSGVFPPTIGGPAAQLDALARDLVGYGYQVHILTYGRPDEKKYPYSVTRVSNDPPSLFKKIVYLLKGVVLAFRADVIYSWDLYTAGLTGLVIKKLLGKKVINRFVGDSAWEKAASRKLIGNDDLLTFQDKRYSNKIESWKKRRKRILINSDYVVVVSDFLKQVAIKIGLPEEKIKVIFNSVDILDTANLDDKEILRQKFNLDGIILLTIARLTPWKGVDMLIDIMPDLIKKYSNIKLVIVGDGVELANLKNLAKEKNLGNSVLFQGGLKRWEVTEHLAMADLFLLNTNYEGMSHTILEAMEVGLPVITTTAGGNPETIIDKQTGLLVNYRDKRQWLEAVSLLLDNPDLAQRIAGQAKDSLKKFSWDTLVSETIKILNP